MKTLELRNLNNTYNKIGNERKYTMHHDHINNNLIIFSPMDNCDVESVCNGIRESAYQYLINELNKNINLVVHWSQVEGTTSDYTIYYDYDKYAVNNLKNKTHKEAIRDLPLSGVIAMKYVEVRNQEGKPIESFDESLD